MSPINQTVLYLKFPVKVLFKGLNKTSFFESMKKGLNRYEKFKKGNFTVLCEYLSVTNCPNLVVIGPLFAEKNCFL